MSTSFAPITVATDAPTLDPTKHVLYQLGMVLGVSDLSQDFTWLSTRGHVAVRELGGYGTATGLRVVADVDTRGPRIVVEPGTAYSPAGKLIRLCKSQCAYLDDWLLQNKDDVASLRNPTTNTTILYVVLCYRDCPTDDVPIPGAPCRTEDQAMQPSRLTDDFTLEFRWHPPDQTEANAIRGFVHWLQRITSVNTGFSLTLEDFEAELLADEEAILSSGCGDTQIVSSPPDSPPSSPPHYVFSETPIPIPSGEECEYLHAAFRIWTTRFRPRIHPDLMVGSCGCDGTAPSATPGPEGCLLLAEISVPLAPSGTVFVVNRGQPVQVRQKCRPILVDLQILQEYLLCATRNQDFVSAPGNVTPAKSFGLPPANGVLDLYSRADHAHGTPDLPPLLGEVTGDIGATVVSKILGIPVVRTGSPTTGEVLTVAGSGWVTANPPQLLPGPVVAATAFGMSKSDGALGEYARADHSHGTPQLPVQVVAAGVFSADGKPLPGTKVFGKLSVTPFPVTNPAFTEYRLEFDGSNLSSTYVIKGTVTTLLTSPIHTIERVGEGPTEIKSISIRVSKGLEEKPAPGFSLEISEILG